MGNHKKTNWSEIVLSGECLEKIDKLAVRRFGDGGLAEEAAEYVLQQLSNNNWNKLQGYAGKCQPTTYVHAVSTHLLESFSRHRFGRPRPPEWLKRQGDLWLRIWQEICIEQQLKISVIDRLIECDLRLKSHIEEVIRTIRARLPWCGQGSAKESVIQESLENIENSVSPVLEKNPVAPDSKFEQEEMQDILNIFHTFFEYAEITKNNNSMNADKLKFESKNNTLRNIYLVLKKIELTDEERIILKMVYQDNINKKIVAQALGLPSYVPGRILKNAFSRIRAAFKEAKIEINADFFNDIT